MAKFDTIFIEIHSGVNPKPQYQDGELVRKALNNFGFARTNFVQMYAWDIINDKKCNERPIPVTVERWERKQNQCDYVFEKTHEVKVSDNSVTAYISTKNRYFTTLPLAINSIIQQTVKPQRFILFDDGDQNGECQDLRNNPLYVHLFNMLDEKKIVWEVIFGKKSGQVANHQSALKIAKTEWIFRLDDDDVAEPDVLEKLLDATTIRTGAIGGLILDPSNRINLPLEEFSSTIQDIYAKPSLQWTKFNSIRSVDHLNNSFLYRKKAAQGYSKNLSVVNHREESMFTYSIKKWRWDVSY